MKSTYDTALRAVLKHEGGYVNHPKDPGGSTNKGVTQKTYDAFRKSNKLPKRSVKLLEDAELKTIYKKQYWDAIRGDELPAGLDYCVFDFAVNSGPDRAARHLQMALGVKVDGHIGMITIDEAEEADAEVVIKKIIKSRLAFMQVARHKETGELLWPTFKNGWTSRLNGVEALSLSLAPDKAVSPPITPIPAPVVITNDEPKSLWAWIVSIFK